MWSWLHNPFAHPSAWSQTPSWSTSFFFCDRFMLDVQTGKAIRSRILHVREAFAILLPYYMYIFVHCMHLWNSKPCCPVWIWVQEIPSSPGIPRCLPLKFFSWKSPLMAVSYLYQWTAVISVSQCSPLTALTDMVSDFIKFISAFFLQGPSGYGRPRSSVEYNQWPVAPVIQSATPTYQTSHPQSE